MQDDVRNSVPQELIASIIYVIRGRKVMLDSDLAELYGVETKQLKRAVRRNITRFPDDFMFELEKEELINLRSQFGTSSWGGTRYSPMVFSCLWKYLHNKDKPSVEGTEFQPLSCRPQSNTNRTNSSSFLPSSS